MSFYQLPQKYQRNVVMKYNNNMVMKYNNNILLRCVFFIVIQSHFNVQILETTNEV